MSHHEVLWSLASSSLQLCTALCSVLCGSGSGRVSICCFTLQEALDAFDSLLNDRGTNLFVLVGYVCPNIP